MKKNWIFKGSPKDGIGWDKHKRADVNSKLLEAQIDEPNYLYMWWLEKALDVGRSIVRIKFSSGGSATGFLIDEDIVITNNHVFENKDDVRNSILEFNYQLNQNGKESKRERWECDPDILFETNKDLDFTITKVKNRQGKKAGEKWGFLKISSNVVILTNERVNIIQHPRGQYKQIAMRDNQIKSINGEYIQYLTDTEYGTSGAPVLDDFLNVVALHSRRVPDPNFPSRWYRNQGFRIDTIYKKIKMYLSY